MMNTSTKRYLRKLTTAVVSLALAAALAACGSKATAPNQGQLVDPPKAQSSQQEGTEQAKRTTYPLKVQDATGKEFVFEKAPERIASTSPSETEILFALGLGSKIVGVSDYCDYPAEAATKPKLGSITKPNEEALIGAGADFVLTGVSMKAPTVDKLRELKINLYQVQPKTMDDVLANIERMGEIFDRQEEARKLVEQMKADRQSVVDAVKSVKPEQRKKKCSSNFPRAIPSVRASF